MKVDNSAGLITDYFNIFGISSAYNDANTTDPTIWLVDVHTATTISGNNANPTGGNDLGTGIELDGSSSISIDGVSYNKGNGTGIYLNGSQADADANDTGGYVLDGSNTYNVTLEKSSSHASGNICISYNGQRVNTGGGNGSRQQLLGHLLFQYRHLRASALKLQVVADARRSSAGTLTGSAASG